jgi:hypothetical protein
MHHPPTDGSQTTPDEVLISSADEQLARADEKMESADEQRGRMEEQPSRPERDEARAARRSPQDRPWLRGLVGLLLAACIFAAALASQSSQGDAVRRWTPQLISTLWLSAEKLAFSARSKPSSVQVAAAQPVVVAQAGPHEVAPTSAAVASESGQLLETMAREVVNVEREIEQLKSSQQQFASDNAKALEQIRASQDETARGNAKAAELIKASQERLAQFIAAVSEQSLGSKTSAPQPQPIAATTPTTVAHAPRTPEGSKPAATDTRTRMTQDQVTAATAVAERVTAATAVAILMARPEIKSVSDLAGKSIAIDDGQSAASGNVRNAMAAAGAAQIQLTANHTKAVDRIIDGEVPASVLALVSPEAAEGFPEIAGFKIFRIPLSERSTKPPLANGKRSS